MAAFLLQSFFRGTRVWAALAGMLLMAVGMGIGRFIYTALMPAMLEQNILTFSQSSTLASVNYLGYLLGCLVLMVAVPKDRRVLRIWLVFSLLATGLLLMAMGVVEHYILMLLIRGLAGVLSAAVLIVGAQYVLGASSHPVVIGCLFGGVGLGIFLGNEWVIGLERAMEWPVGRLWVAAGAGAVVLGLIAVFACFRLERDASNAATQAWKPQVYTVSWGILVAVYGVAGFGYIISMTYIPVAVRTLLGNSLLAEHVWSLVGLAAIPSCFLWISLGERWGILNALIVNLLVQGGGVLLSLTSADIVVQTVSALLVGLTFMGTVSLALPLARTLPFPAFLNELGTMTAVYGIGQIVGPLVVDYAFDGTDGIMATQVWAGTFLLGAAFALRLGRRTVVL